MTPSRARWRLCLDLFWVAAFAASLTWLLVSAPHGQTTQPQDGMLLELHPGVQQQALFRHARRVGSVRVLTRRQGPGWLLERRIRVGAKEVALIEQELRADLSLSRLALKASLDELGALGGLPAPLLRELGPVGTLSLAGGCRVETGSCVLVGKVGRRPMHFPIFPGRGPVLTAAVYPLLARGRLGNSVELSLFDPLALRSRRVTLRIVGGETLELAGKRHDAVHVHTDVDGLGSELWLDKDGMPLREELPLGFRADHETWSADE